MADEVKEQAKEYTVAEATLQGLINDVRNKRMIAESNAMQVQDRYRQFKEQYEAIERQVYNLRGVEDGFVAILQMLQEAEKGSED